MSEAFIEGQLAFWGGYKLSDNPYTGEDQEQLWYDWKEGWYDAAWDE